MDDEARATAALEAHNRQMARSFYCRADGPNRKTLRSIGLMQLGLLMLGSLSGAEFALSAIEALCVLWFAWPPITYNDKQRVALSLFYATTRFGGLLCIMFSKFAPCVSE